MGLRWGIMGTGGIAETMATVLLSVGSEVVAVGSARPGAAESFARERDIPQAVPSHRAVAEVDEVDIVYVATTNDRHHGDVLNCAELGKPVLCEKPVALNIRHAGEMIEATRGAGVFFMEALWMRFQPFLAQVDELIAVGTIGEVRDVQADFFYPASTDPARRWMNRYLGGGSLLDLGIYPLSLVHHLLGLPLEFEAVAEKAATGVDAETRVSSRHAAGATAAVASSFITELANEAIVTGTEATIRIHARFHHSRLVTVERDGDVVASYHTGYEGHGFRFEVAEAERCVAEGLTESPLRPHADTLEVLQWMDGIRSRCGIDFPADQS